MPDWDVIVIGAGAAGLLGAARAAERSRRTLLIEKNRKPGVKILMSGGTRCNLTQNTDARGIVEAFGAQGRFLHSALAALGPQDLVDLFIAEGVPLKVEPTGKVFPQSDRAADILNALLGRLTRSGATLALGEEVRGIARGADGFEVVTAARILSAERILVTTGGQSYPGCGTRGDGYAWVRNLGHTIIPPRPALVPVTTAVEWVHALKGITVPDVMVTIVADNCSLNMAEPRRGTGMSRGSHARPQHRAGGKSHDRTWRGQRRGSIVFTHFGLSGPAVLDVSREITGQPGPASLALEFDFLPDWTDDGFADSLRRTAQAIGGKRVSALCPEILPRRLADALLARAEIRADLRAAEMSGAQRSRLVQELKHCRIPVTGTLGFPRAEVTAGGVPLDEVESRTLQSRIVPGLFLAGEILDLDGPIGGYNFQAAFSTGWLAGGSV